MAISDEKVREVLGEYARLGPEPAVETAWPDIADLRRGRRLPERRPRQVTLVERNGLAIWEWGYARGRSLSTPGRRAHRAGGLAPPAGKEIFSHIVEPLGTNQIGELLLDFDCRRNPVIDRKSGWKLRQWHDGRRGLGDPAPKEAKNVLVIVHGTASCAEHIVNEIQLAEGGRKLLADASKHYSAVLAFEHPTVSMSPVLNALDLSVALAPYGTCTVDIICHSRGGLVANWWMHIIDKSVRKKRCVFVGSPLQGTNLANPAKLRSSLHLLASYGRVLGNVGVAAGFLALPMTILKVACSVVDLTTKIPLLDAALAMIPGLAAQSFTENNQELIRLNARKSRGQDAPAHFYIRANFASTNEGWRFWRYFIKDPKLRLIDAAVDTFVFPGENDLVVDTDSMLDDVGGSEFKFPSKDGIVHHTNYFEQKPTIDKIREWLKIPDSVASVP